MGSGSGGFYVVRDMMKQAAARARSTYHPDNTPGTVALFAFCILLAGLGSVGFAAGALLLLVVAVSGVYALRIGRSRSWRVRQEVLVVAVLAVAAGIYWGAVTVLHHSFPPVPHYVHMLAVVRHDHLLTAAQRATRVASLRAAEAATPFSLSAAEASGLASMPAYVALLGGMALVRRRAQANDVRAG